MGQPVARAGRRTSGCTGRGAHIGSSFIQCSSAAPVNLVVRPHARWGLRPQRARRESSRSCGARMVDLGSSARLRRPSDRGRVAASGASDRSRVEAYGTRALGFCARWAGRAGKLDGRRPAGAGRPAPRQLVGAGPWARSKSAGLAFRSGVTAWARAAGMDGGQRTCVVADGASVTRGVVVCAAELAVAAERAQHRCSVHPVPLRAPAEPDRSAATPNHSNKEGT